MVSEMRQVPGEFFVLSYCVEPARGIYKIDGEALFGEGYCLNVPLRVQLPVDS